MTHLGVLWVVVHDVSHLRLCARARESIIHLRNVQGRRGLFTAGLLFCGWSCIQGSLHPDPYTSLTPQTLTNLKP